MISRNGSKIMTKLGVLVGEDNWMFFREIYDDLSAHFRTEVYTPKTYNTPLLYGRLNRWAFRSQIQGMLRRNDVCFFEWASELLSHASHMPKQCIIVTRLHRFEMYQWANQINWDVVDRVILVSKAMEREFVTRFPEQASKTFVSSPSTSLIRFNPKEKAFAGDIGILCNLSPRKRVYELILAFHELLQQKDDFHLHIAGGYSPADEDYHTALHHIVQKLRLRDKVTFYGHVTDTEDWYGKIDIFVSNSFSEGLQVAPMEAMASGCYCLSHRWAGADELVPEENLFVTGRELQEKILWYSELPETEKQSYRDRMRAVACEEFDMDHTKAQIRQVIEQVASDRTKSAP